MNFFKNYLSTLLFLFFAYILYTHNNFYSGFISGEESLSFVHFHISILHILYGILVLYIVLLIPLYFVYPQKSKARILIAYAQRVARGDNRQEDAEKTALLAWIVKIFFAPLMITWLTGHIFDFVNKWYALIQARDMMSGNVLQFFNEHFFWTAFSTILFVDVFLFTMGYLIETPFLKNTIRSVEPTIIGWGVALLCYPPFNSFVSNVIGWYSSDFPSFATPEVHIGMNVLILLLMSVYAWASFSLGFKASNLTNRGIVTKGPYAYIRHPAYMCKNLAWFIGGFPMIYYALNFSELSIFTVLLGLFGWTFLYYMRAMTEENHLSLDPEYRKYKKQVPYKFLPGIW